MSTENQTTLRQADNVVEVEGILAEIRIEEKTSQDGKEFITGEIDIQTDEASTHTFRVYSKKFKDDGTENGIYKGLHTVMTEYKSIASVGKEEADRVRVNRGQLGLNEYYGQDGTLKSFPQFSTNFINRLQAGEELSPKAEVEVEMFVYKIVPEIKNEEETGRLLVTGIVPQYGGRVTPITFVVEDEGAVSYIQDNYSKGSTVKVFADLINRVNKKVTKVEVGFGKPKEKVTQTTVRELVITGGSVPYEDDNAKKYAVEAIQKAMTEREIYLQQLKDRKNNKPEEKKSESKGFDTKSSGSKKPTIATDDLPF